MQAWNLALIWTFGVQISVLTAENEMYKDCTGKSVAELKLISSKAVALEVHTLKPEVALCAPSCSVSHLRESPGYGVIVEWYVQESYSSANDHIRALRQQLDVAQRKLEAAECQLELRRGECESQISKYEEVVERLTEAEQKVKEGELLRRKLHNTILVRCRWLNGVEASCSFCNLFLDLSFLPVWLISVGSYCAGAEGQHPSVL